MAFTVFRAVADDHATFVRLFAELAVIEAPPSAARFAELIAPDAFFLRDGADVLGYAWARRRADKLHVVHVVVDPSHRRRGVGKALLDVVAERGRREGFTDWMLNVKPENTAARSLYEARGMLPAFESVSMRLAWDDVAKLPCAPVATRQLAPAEDARFEAALAFSIGEVSGYRSLDRLIFGSEMAGAPVAVGVLDPPFPGASPFRVTAEGQARALFEAMRPHALAQHDHLLVFVENDPRLETELTRAGATPAMRILRMEGKIPQ